MMVLFLTMLYDNCVLPSMCARAFQTTMVLRLLLQVPEIAMILKGMRIALRWVFLVLIVQGINIVFFAFVMLGLTRGTEVGHKYFPSVRTAMSSLVFHGIFLDDITEVLQQLGGESWQCIVGFIAFIMIAFYLVVVMCGIGCRVVGEVADTEKEELACRFFKARIFHLMEDCSGDRELSKGDFQTLLLRPEFAHAGHSVGVDVVGLVDMLDYMYADREKISRDNLIEIILELRGSNNAAVKHIVDLRKLIAAQGRN